MRLHILKCVFFHKIILKVNLNIILLMLNEISKNAIGYTNFDKEKVY